MNDFNHISGDQTELVYMDVERRLGQALTKSNSLYKKAISKKVKKQTGLNFNANSLLFCSKGPSSGNDTSVDCPIDKNQDKKEFIVIVQNPQLKSQKSYAKIKLPNKNYKPWCGPTANLLMPDQIFLSNNTTTMTVRNS